MLSQVSVSELNLGTMVFWMVMMIAAAVLLGVVVVAARRWMFQDAEPSDTMWTLHDLAAMRDSGALTIEQYERLKEKLIREVSEAGPAQRADVQEGARMPAAAAGPSDEPVRPGDGVSPSGGEALRRLEDVQEGDSSN